MRTLIAVLMLMVATVGCTNEPTAPAPSPDVSLSQPKSADRGDVAYQTMLDNFPQLRSVPKSILDDTARSVCSALDSGLTLQEIVAALATQPNIRPRLAGAVLAYAIFVHCPEYESQVPDM